MSNPIDLDQFAVIAEALPDALLLLDPKGTITALNSAARPLFPAAEPGSSLGDWVCESEQELALLLKQWRRSAGPTLGIVHQCGPDGSSPALRCEGSALERGRAILLRCRTQKQGAQAFSVLNDEIAKLQRANHQLRDERARLAQRVEERTQTIQESERRLRGILEALAEAVLCFDRHGTVLSSNAAADALFGYSARELNGVCMAELLPELWRDQPLGAITALTSLESRARHRDGSQFPVELKVRELLLQDDTVYTALIADITERKAYLHNLKRLAERDALTGLHNRRYFHDELNRLQRVQDPKTGNFLLFIDLDNFKYVNDEFGHAAGDQVLRDVAAMLQRQVRSSDLLARLGGDEFAVLLCNSREEEVAAIAERMRSAMDDYVYQDDKGHADVGCSIGVACIRGSFESEQALKRAEFACRQAKKRGRNCVWRFTENDAAAVAAGAHDMGWVRRIKQALRDDLFELHAQPILNTGDDEVAAWEILVRLADVPGELIMPNAFIPAAERFGLMPDIDRWVIRNAVALAAQERSTLSINLSGTTLAQPEIADFIAREVQRHDVSPQQFIFEITETAAIANLGGTAVVLSKLHALGCRTALDDFGAGMSSFAYLRELPVDWVKIDGRFVRELAKNSVDQAMVKAMHDIAHTLGKRTVAEFVENVESLAILRELGVDFVQGYFVGRPQAREKGDCKRVSRVR